MDGSAHDFIKANIGAIGIGAGSAVVGSIVGYAAGKNSVRRHKRKATTVRRASRRHRAVKHRKHFRRRFTPHTAGKRKDRSTRRIRYTKKGQPYVILRSGKARFISNKSARSSHKRKGGRN